MRIAVVQPTTLFVIAVLSALTIGCHNDPPTFIVNHDSITLDGNKFTEDEFFEHVKKLDSKHIVFCDVFDVDSSKYIYDHFHPKLMATIQENSKLRPLLDVRIVEE